MSASDKTERRRGAVPLTELVGKVLDPMIARRGFANADLIAAWPAIAGRAYADCTEPEKVVWPRRQEGVEPEAGILFLKVDGPKAIFVQHELPQILERINGFLGYAAIGQVRIVQKAVKRRSAPPRTRERSLLPTEQAQLDSTVQSVEDDALRAALARLGHSVLTARDKDS